MVGLVMQVDALLAPPRVPRVCFQVISRQNSDFPAIL